MSMSVRVCKEGAGARCQRFHTQCGTLDNASAARHKIYDFIVVVFVVVAVFVIIIFSSHQQPYKASYLSTHSSESGLKKRVKILRGKILIAVYRARGIVLINHSEGS